MLVRSDKFQEFRWNLHLLVLGILPVPPWFNWFLKIKLFLQLLSANASFLRLQVYRWSCISFDWQLSCWQLSWPINTTIYSLGSLSTNGNFPFSQRTGKKTFLGASRAGNTFAIVCLKLLHSSLFIAPYKFFTRLPRRLILALKGFSPRTPLSS